jgi:hypothetical protein
MKRETVTCYRILSTNGKFAGLSLGFVRHYEGKGWRYLPTTQRMPSRKYWPTPEDSLKGRIENYRLEPV